MLKRALALLVLVVAFLTVSHAPAVAANDEMTTSGYYVAHPDGGGSTFLFHVVFVLGRVNVGGTVYLIEEDGEGGYRYRHGDDYFTFDAVAHTWTFYDQGFAVFGGTYEPDPL